jgi:hypothetical protein
VDDTPFGTISLAQQKENSMTRQSLRGLDKGGISQAFDVADAAYDTTRKDRNIPPITADPELALGANARAIQQAQRDLLDGDASLEETEDPTLVETLGAAFQTDNIAVNLYMRATED